MHPRARVLLGAAHVDELPALLLVVDDLVAQDAVAHVVAIGRGVGRGRITRPVGGPDTALLLPLQPAAVHHVSLGVAEKLEHPEGVASPPVVLVAVEDDGGVGRDADLRHQRREAGPLDVIAAQLIVQIGRPVHVHGTWHVAGGVQQRVFVRLDDAHAGVTRVRGHPLGGDERVRVTVAAIGDSRHGRPPERAEDAQSITLMSGSAGPLQCTGPARGGVGTARRLERPAQRDAVPAVFAVVAPESAPPAPAPADAARPRPAPRRSPCAPRRACRS